MFCPKCGKEISNTSKFCPKCGALTADTTDAPNIKNSKKKLYIGIGGALAAIVAVALVVVLVVLPQNRYAKATELFKNKEYTAAMTALEKLPENYKDIKELYPYYSAYEAYANRDYSPAAEQFESLGSYKDAEEMAEESRYLYAQNLFDAGKYDAAYTAFEKITRYKDSEEQLNECRYRQALDLMKIEGASAKELFAVLGEYKDSAEKLLECDYYAAMNLLDNKAYGEAYASFQLLGDYKDSQDMLLECRYRKAQDLLDEKDYDGALERFTAIIGYKDSEEMGLEVEYLKGIDLLENGELDAAYGIFGDIAGYKDVDSLRTECEYLKAQEFFAAGDYAEAAERFEAVGDYKDSKDLLAQCAKLKAAQRDIRAELSKSLKTLFTDLADYNNFNKAFPDGLTIYYIDGGRGTDWGELTFFAVSERQFYIKGEVNETGAVHAYTDNIDGAGIIEGETTGSYTENNGYNNRYLWFSIDPGGHLYIEDNVSSTPTFDGVYGTSGHVGESDLYHTYIFEQVKFYGVDTSLMTMKIFDFDGDGVLDLYYKFPAVPADPFTTPEGFCTIIDGQVVELLSANNYRDAIFTQYSKSLSEHVLGFADFFGLTLYYSINNGKIVLIEKCMAEPYGGDKYYVNDEEVSEEVYNRVRENYVAPIDDYYKLY